MDAFLKELFEKYDNFPRYETVATADYTLDDLTINPDIDELEIKTLNEIKNIIASSTLLDGIEDIQRADFYEFLLFFNRLAKENFSTLEVMMSEDPKIFSIKISSEFFSFNTKDIFNMKSVINNIKDVEIYYDENRKDCCIISIDFNFTPS